MLYPIYIKGYSIFIFFRNTVFTFPHNYKYRNHYPHILKYSIQLFTSLKIQFVDFRQLEIQSVFWIGLKFWDFIAMNLIIYQEKICHFGRCLSHEIFEGTSNSLFDVIFLKRLRDFCFIILLQFSILLLSSYKFWIIAVGFMVFSHDLNTFVSS